jgi:hypothetical protein
VRALCVVMCFGLFSFPARYGVTVIVAALPFQ